MPDASLTMKRWLIMSVAAAGVFCGTHTLVLIILILTDGGDRHTFGDWVVLGIVSGMLLFGLPMIGAVFIAVRGEVRRLKWLCPRCAHDLRTLRPDFLGKIRCTECGSYHTAAPLRHCPSCHTDLGRDLHDGCPVCGWQRKFCPKCTYDLRGGTHQGCPECGWNRSEQRL